MARRLVIATVLLATVSFLGGCVGAVPTAAPSTPKLSPPVIVRPGVLRAVVDLGYPPYGGIVKGQKVGFDVDVAAAIADQLGLKLEILDGTPTVGAADVASNTADLVLGGLTVNEAVSSQLAFAGTYAADGPAVFAARGTTATVTDLSAQRIAVQRDSEAYWALVDEYGQGSLLPMPTLYDALKAAASGQADVAAGDALVGAYLIRQLPSMVYLGQIGSAYPIGIGVSAGKPKMESEVRAILDRLAAQGVLDTLRRKWVGDLPALKVTLEPSVDTSATASSGSSGTPAVTTTP
jgi:polar amino acid transport system substrate-binding protein